MNKKIYLTPDGLEELKKELTDLSKIRRPEVVTRVADARDMGDLSENAEYHAAREELSLIDGRIEELEELLKQAVIIKNGHIDLDSVQLGSTVKVAVNGKEDHYQVVGEWEADPREKKISHESPLGKALIGKKVGESAEVIAPAGKVVYTIVSVN